MATLDNGVGEITLTKKSGTVLTLATEKKYVDTDVQFTLNAQSGAGSAGSATVDANVEESGDNYDVGGGIGEKSSTIPSGYHFRLDVTGSGNSNVTTAGWLDTGALPTATTTEILYFPVDQSNLTINTPTLNTQTGGLSLSATTTSGFSTNRTDTTNYQLPTKGRQVATLSKDADVTVSTSGFYMLDNVIVPRIIIDHIEPSTIRYGVPVGIYGNTTPLQTIYSTTGSFTGASTVSSGQTAATAGQIATGYSAWVNGVEVKGNIPTKTSADLVVNSNTVNVPAGYYATDASKSVGVGSVSMIQPTINTSNGLVTSGATISSGFVTSSSLSSTLQLNTQAGMTMYPSSESQTIPANVYTTGAISIQGVTTSGISASTIMYGTTVNVGCASDDDSVLSVTGQFTGANTVSPGLTAATSSQIISGYSAWVNGTEIMGKIQRKTWGDITLSGQTLSVPAGVYDNVTVFNINSIDVSSDSTLTVNVASSASTLTGRIDVYNEGTVSVTNEGAVFIDHQHDTGSVNINADSPVGPVYATVIEDGRWDTQIIGTGMSLAYSHVGVTEVKDAEKELGTQFSQNGNNNYVEQVTVLDPESDDYDFCFRPTCNVTASGYIPIANNLGAYKYYKIVTTDPAFSGVTLTTPESGTRQFSITVPDGTSNTVTFVFNVNTSGNVTVTES